MSASERPAHLEPSKLGTKEYWDDLYTNELSNNAADPADIGTVWFDDSDAEAKILAFLDELPDLNHQQTSFLDLGCGNGSLLFALRYGGNNDDDDDDDEDNDEKQGWRGPLLGVDYSPQSIALANQIAFSRQPTDPSTTTAAAAAPITFQHWDLLSSPLSDVLSGSRSTGWDVVLDKGTFDAICLADARDDRGRRLCEGYRDRVLPLVRPDGGRFIVTSCNWTEPELRAWFEADVDNGIGRFVLDGRVEYPSFSFGGVKGQTITTLCFRKVS